MPTHRFALSLSGGLALGAYEAGVLSQLYKDIFAFNQAKLGSSLVIDTLSGASAGSITGLLLAQALALNTAPDKFEEIIREAWVAQADAIAFLEPKDGPEEAVFTQDQIDKIVAGAIQPAGEGPFAPKQAIALWMAVTNLDGIPTRIQFGDDENNKTSIYTYTYRDYVPYLICGPVIKEVTIPTEDLDPTSDATQNDPPEKWWNRCTARTWQDAAASAIASGSFPVAFKTKPLTRNLTLYGDYKCFKKDGWPDTLNCQVSDGGMLGNEPIGKAIDGVAFLERLDPGRAGDGRTFLMIEPNPTTLDMIGKALDEVNKQPYPNGINPFVVVFMIASVYFTTALYGDFITAQNVNDQLRRVAKMKLTKAQRDEIETIFGLTYKKPVILDRIPANPPSQNRLASDFWGDFGGFLSEEFRAYDFAVGQGEARAWITTWLGDNAGNLQIEKGKIDQFIGAQPTPDQPVGNLACSGWCTLTEDQRKDAANAAFTRLEELVLRWMHIDNYWARHVAGGALDGAWDLLRGPAIACPQKPPANGHGN